MKTKAKQAKRIRTGDKVVVISGNERGKSGTVLKRIDNDKLLVQGINVRKKAVKPSENNPKGGFNELEAPIHASNVMIATEKDQGFRVKVRLKDNQKELYGVVDGQEVVHRTHSKLQKKG